MMVIGNLSVSSSLLGAYLKSSGLTQAAFAELVGVSEAAVQHWLTGYAKPREKVRKSIQSITGIRRVGVGCRVGDDRPGELHRPVRRARAATS